MIKDRALWESWEAKTILSQPADFRRNLRLLEEMYEYAVARGAFPAADPLAGLEVRIRLAREVNARTTA